MESKSRESRLARPVTSWLLQLRGAAPSKRFLNLENSELLCWGPAQEACPLSPQLRHVGSKKWHRAVCGRCGLAMRRVEKQVGEVALLRLIPGVSWAQVVKKIPTTDTVFSAQSKHSSHRKSECQGKQTEYSSVPGRAPQPRKRLLLAPHW